jgi:NADH:ubiquinone oxidoreductase subunit 2 (subunit N)
VAGELVAPAVGAWTGALVVCLGHALAARAPRVLGFGGGVLLAQAGALTVLASLSARGAVFGVLPGALVASALPCLGLVGVISILCESRRGRPVAECAGLLPRNRWLAAALVLSLLGLVGLPLTVGFAPRVRLVMAGAGAGLLAPVGLVVINAVVLLVLSLRLLRPLLHVRATESEPFVGESGATLLTALTAAAVVVSELAWPGFGGGG